MLFEGTKIHREMSRLSLQLVFNTTLLKDDDELAKHGVTSILNKRMMEWYESNVYNAFGATKQGVEPERSTQIGSD